MLSEFAAELDFSHVSLENLCLLRCHILPIVAMNVVKVLNICRSFKWTGLSGKYFCFADYTTGTLFFYLIGPSQP